MKRFLLLLLIAVLLIGCRYASGAEYSDAYFTATLPASFERVQNSSVICFAPHGNPVRSSSITFYITELNWYFDSFTAEEYESALKNLCGYDSLTLSSMESCRIDGNDARRIACSVELDQGVHDLVIYAVSADHIYFFTLLNREGDSYVEPFETMMKSIRMTGDK